MTLDLFSFMNDGSIDGVPANYGLQVLPPGTDLEVIPPRPFAHVLRDVKAAGEDREWYPTTMEIIHALARAIPDYVEHRYSSRGVSSLLDVGAGNGKVLREVQRIIAEKTRRDGNEKLIELFAIEKSSVLLGELDRSIFVVGTDFEAQSLYSKKVDVIFSNPPYSVFEEWAAKIIRESAAPLVFLVIPDRWEKSQDIKDALASRKGASTKVLGKFDFSQSEDRQARALVHLVRVSLPSDPDEAFEAFFNSHFGEYVAKHNAREREEAEAAKAAREAAGDNAPAYGGRVRPYHSLTVGENYPAALCSLYRLELASIQANYDAISKLDPDLLSEFDVYPKKIMELLKKRTEELRIEYWRELFSRLKPITNRLTAASRKAMLGTLHGRMDVDFTEDNIHAILIWAIKNANDYMDRQLLEVYDLMVTKANVTNYKSNARVFEKRGWRYEENPNTHYKLELRIVCERAGGIETYKYAHHAWERFGLTESAGDFISDLVTLANNLGFPCADSPMDLKWTSGESVTFHYRDTKGNLCELMKIRAFMNRNIHVKFAKSFIVALNVEHGRLRGWLRDARHAEEELQEPTAGQFFKSTFQILPGSGASLLLS